jgi:hypothetical protein
MTTLDTTEPRKGRPTVDDMGEWSFPPSDPPVTWTWDVEPPPVKAAVTADTTEGL